MSLRIASIALVTLLASPAVAQCPGNCGKAATEPSQPTTVCPTAAAGTCPSAAASGCGRVAVETEHCHWLEVDGVVPNSPAERAGVQAGDALYSYGGRTVGCMRDYATARAAATGDSVTAVFNRDRQQVSVRVARGQQMGVYLHEWQKDVVPDPDARVIPDVPRLYWATGKSSTFMAALEAALPGLGDRADYTFLSGASGAAFRTHFFDTWCPSSPYPGCGYNSAGAAFASRGVETREHVLSTDGKNRQQVLAAIKASIDDGVPVLAWGIGEGAMAFEYSVIVGYQKNGDELFIRSYGDTRKGYDIAPRFPKAVTILRRPASPASDSAGIAQSFRIVVDNMVTEKYGEYWSGLTAFDKWMARITTDSFKGLDSMAFSNVVQANYWTLSRLVADRRTGLDFLGRLTDQYLPGSAQVFGELARLYAEEVDILGPIENDLPCPGAATRPEHWTAEQKARQVAALVRARVLEERALPLWRQLAGAK